MLKLDLTPPPTRTYSELREIAPDGSVAFDVNLLSPIWETPPFSPVPPTPLSLTVIFDPRLPHQPVFGEETLRFGGDREWPIREVVELPNSLGMKLAIMMDRVKRRGRRWAEISHCRYWGDAREVGKVARNVFLV